MQAAVIHAAPYTPVGAHVAAADIQLAGVQDIPRSGLATWFIHNTRNACWQQPFKGLQGCGL